MSNMGRKRTHTLFERGGREVLDVVVVLCALSLQQGGRLGICLEKVLCVWGHQKQKLPLVDSRFSSAGNTKSKSFRYS